LIYGSLGGKVVTPQAQARRECLATGIREHEIIDFTTDDLAVNVGASLAEKLGALLAEAAAELRIRRTLDPLDAVELRAGK
jgi:hypothetical protein